MTTHTRRAIPADHAALLALIQRFYRQDQHGYDEPKVERALIPLLEGDQYGHVWVMVEDTTERLLGYAVVTWSWSLESGGRDALLDEIFVEDQGKGLGSALLSRAMIAAAAAGASVMFLETESHNTRVRPFYTRHGFESEDSIWMVAPLDRSESSANND